MLQFQETCVVIPGGPSACHQSEALHRLTKRSCSIKRRPFKLIARAGVQASKGLRLTTRKGPVHAPHYFWQPQHVPHLTAAAVPPAYLG